jgi:hypothetical protein
MLKRLAFVAAALSVAGCQQNASIREDTFGKFRQIDSATVALKREIRVPAGRARVYLQNDKAGVGDRVISGGFNSYKPHCAFEISRIDHDGFAIRAETFVVTRIQQTMVQVVSGAPIMLASLASWNGSQSYFSGYHFWLTSETQPDVTRMTCYGVYAELYELDPPTLKEINAALGAVAELRY